MASLYVVSQILYLFACLSSTNSSFLRPRLSNDLAVTPPMGTVNGTLTWNPDRFPSGYPALGDFIHGLGLRFGVYSDGGIQMCMTGEPAQAGSLFHETTDANTFASWGADLLKYDNCYSDAAAGYPNADYTPNVSPEPRYANMTKAILATGRPILFQICVWGVDFPSAWAPTLGNSWRIANDIVPTYTAIPRILNQAVSQTSFAGPGRWLDLDMLEVGNDVFTTAEEQTHFSMWAILKSPLIIGGALKDNYTSISAASLAILKNSDVVSYSQDSLGIAASFRRRWTDQGYEVWAGPLSGGRIVVAVINLDNVARALTLNLPDVGYQRAEAIKDVWNGVDATNVVTSYTGAVAAHGTMLLELSNATAAGQYSVGDATVSGNSSTFNNIYGETSSCNYILVLIFANTSASPTSVVINDSPHTLAAGATSLTTTITLLAANNNSLTISSTPLPESINITAPTQSFYPSTSFNPVGNSSRTTCYTGLCTPVGSKIGYLSPIGYASANITSPSSSLVSPTESKYSEMYFCNNDIAFATAFTTGTNTRNMTISVNGEVTRIEVPLSGRSSELFSPGLGWQDTGTFGVLTSGWVEGINEVVVGNDYGDEGLVSYGADFVGLGVYW